MPLDSLLTFFLKEHAHFALVVDELVILSAWYSWMMCWNRLWGTDQDEFDPLTGGMRESLKTAGYSYAVNGAITLFDLAITAA